MFSIFIKSQISYNYKAFAMINNSDIGEIFPTTSTVIFNYEKKIITIIKADKSKENYKIISKKKTDLLVQGINISLFSLEIIITNIFLLFLRTS